MTSPSAKTILNDARLNLLIGSGASRPHFKTLCNMESALTTISQSKAEPGLKQDLDALCKAQYTHNVVRSELTIGLLEELDENTTEHATISGYADLFGCIYRVISKRETPVTSRQINIFTTNYDTCIEHSLESLGLRYNDGFDGRVKPLFRLSNYGFIYKRQSLLYEYVTDVPSFNLFKLHGSLNWSKSDDGQILYKSDKADLEILMTLSDKVTGLESFDADDLEKLNEYLSLGIPSEIKGEKPFLEKFNDLLIVNPTKKKFEETLLDRNYYEMLRMFSNELEKENSVLCVIGFSFADEHIREIVSRSLAQNPTLTVLCFCHGDNTKTDILSYREFSALPFENFVALAPSDYSCESLTTSQISKCFFDMSYNESESE